MIRTNAKEARQNFSHLMDQVENGEEVFILRRGRVIARIVPYIKPASKPLPRLKAFRNTIKLTGPSLSKMIIQERTEA